MTALATLVAMVTLAQVIPDVASVAIVTVEVDTSQSIQEVGPMFLGVTLDSGRIRDHWSEINLGDPTVRVMAKALSPCYIRVGGTSGDALTFDPDTHVTTKIIASNTSSFNMSAEDWEELNEFVAAANWSLIFGLNVLKRHGQDWDPANARQLLDLSQRKGFPLAGLELGNEPNIFPGQYNMTVTPEQLAGDFSTLREVKASYPAYQSVPLLGPDVSAITPGAPHLFLDIFLTSGGAQVVDVVTFHHYYMNGQTATKERFTDVRTLESLRPILKFGVDLVNKHAPGKPLWLGETSTGYHGGTPGISDRYIASFMWLDKLGMAAETGLQGVLRQSYFGRNYSLLDYDLKPTSDYWVTLLHKRLVGGRVLSVSTSDSSNHTRVYAHCGQSPNSVVLFAMNLNSDPVQLELSPFPNALLRLYVFSPESGDLLSRNVLLNGRLLAMNGQELPPLVPTLHKGSFTLPGLRFAFIQMDDVNVPACNMRSELKNTSG